MKDEEQKSRSAAVCSVSRKIYSCQRMNGEVQQREWEENERRWEREDIQTEITAENQ